MNTEGIDLGPVTPAPAPAPAPQPAPQPAPAGKVSFLPPGWYMALVLAVAFAWYNRADLAHLWPHREPAAPDPIAACTQAGRVYAKVLPAGHAAGLNKAAEAVESGKSVDDARAIEQAEFLRFRNEKWDSLVRPALNAVQPEGADLSVSANRAAFGRALRAVATGEVQ